MDPVLTHLAHHVRDIDACIDFYRDYCALDIVRERGAGNKRTVWLAERGREDELVLVLIAGGPGRDPREGDFSHLGFALEDRARVEAIAAKAKHDGRLIWPPREEPYPVGFYCGVRDPDGTVVEFSYGQPLGPSAAANGGPRP